MSVTLDGEILFDEQQFDIEGGSYRRASMERAVPGLDGVLSIDLGVRERKVKQNGGLRATSRSQINDRIRTISAYMDGGTHTLVTGNGEQFDNLRMDIFKVSKQRTDGSGVAVDYEIIYTQLKVQQ